MTCHRRPPHLALIGALLAALALTLPATAVASGATRLVRYDGWQARVPASWPVIRLAAHPRTCVRFDRHAVYLGTPGIAQRCPAHTVGRTEAILVSPRHAPAGVHGHARRAGAAATTIAGLPSAGAVAQIARARVTVTATWRADPVAVRTALGLGSVRAMGVAARRFDRAAATRARAAAAAAGEMARTHDRDAATTTAAAGRQSRTASVTFPGAATAGQVYTGLGFDACSTPSTAAMTAWSASPFRAIGVYIGGENMACSQTNLNSVWTATEAAAGWHLIPIYVGLQAPNNGCGCAPITSASATTQGTTDAQTAVEDAQAVGIGTGNPIYLDMENYSRTTTASAAVLAYVQAWTAELHALGYSSGVYSSELSGISDLVAQAGTTYVEPDDIWIANWNGTASTADAVVPATEWANHQRLHQYRGGHNDDYGGTTINVDSDYVDAETAAPSVTTVTSTVAAAPTLAVAPQANGTIKLTASWAGASGVAQWEILGGTSPTALSPVVTIPASQTSVVTNDGYGYFQLVALGAGGVTLGTSGTVVTSPHIAMFGHTAFVPSVRGPGGLPVECFQITACRISTTIYVGHHLLARTPFQAVAAGGGVVHFPLIARSRRFIAKAGNAGVPVWVTIRTSSGAIARSGAGFKLVRFTATGVGPTRVPATSSALRLIGGTAFVSHGWTGGVLVACLQSTPCVATPSLRIGATAVATAVATTIGAGEVGYLPFRMTSAGHLQLMRATGNQLGVTVTVATTGSGLVAGATATGSIALDAF